MITTRPANGPAVVGHDGAELSADFSSYFPLRSLLKRGGEKLPKTFIQPSVITSGTAASESVSQDTHPGSLCSLTVQPVKPRLD